jgi:hypothetical protein
MGKLTNHVIYMSNYSFINIKHYKSMNPLDAISNNIIAKIIKNNSNNHQNITL